MTLHLGVDAFNLAADRRGMGRYARGALRDLACMDVHTTLLVRDARAVRELEYEFRSCDVRVWRSVRNEAFDTVWYPWNGMRFRMRAPAIVTMHDAFAFTYAHRNPVARWREQQPIRRAVRWARALVTVSRWSAGELARVLRLEPARFAVAPAAPDTAFWSADAAGPTTESPYVLVVGGPEERKNLPFFFDAYAGAFGRGGPLLVVAGTLRASDEATLAGCGIAFRRVRPDDAALRDLYRGALAVAVPSLAEGYGLTALEAMCCGAPVLAADAAALPEACDGAALLAGPADREAWIEALQALWNDRELRERLRERSLRRAGRLDPAAPAKTILALARRLRAADR